MKETKASPARRVRAVTLVKEELRKATPVSNRNKCRNVEVFDADTRTTTCRLAACSCRVV
jgi:hypothetical protein